MIDDDDEYRLARCEALIARERDLLADRRRRDRFWRRVYQRDDLRDGDRRLDRERDHDCLADRRLDHEDAEHAEDREEAVEERRLLGIAGFGLGGGGAALVVIGIVLMAVAYFGFGAFDSFGGGYLPYDAEGYTPDVGLYPASAAGGYPGSDLLSQRPMTFMGGGFLFLAGWILVVASRMRALLTEAI